MGIAAGIAVGTAVGVAAGIAVGTAVGVAAGTAVGTAVGVAAGTAVGRAVTVVVSPDTVSCSLCTDVAPVPLLQSAPQSVPIPSTWPLHCQSADLPL